MPSLIKDKSGVFYIVFCHQSKRIWRSLGTKDRRAAYKRIFEEQDSKPGKKGLTLFQAEKEYLAFVRTNLAPKTNESYTKTFKHLEEHFGDRPLEEITPREIELYKSKRAGEVSPNTVNHELRMLRAFLNKLVDWKLLHESPCARAKDIRVVDTIRPYLSKEDLMKLLALTWEDVDLKQGTLLVHSTIGHQTKWGKIRLVPINTALRDLLEKMPKTEGLIFTGERGGWKRGDFVGRSFKKAVRDCGLDSRLHFHSLRHTFASLLVKEGVSPHHVQRLLGHSSSRVTEIYAHLGTTELSGSVEKLARMGDENKR